MLFSSFFTLDKVFLDCRSTFLVLQYKWNANAQIEKPNWTLILMTYTCLSTKHGSSKGVKIASIWNISYQFIYQLTDLNCAFLADQAITQNYMCLLLYADNQYAVAKIGDKNRGGGGVTRFFPRQLKSKIIKTLRYLQTNYRSLQMNYRYLQTVQYIPIRYSIEKVQKKSKSLPYGATIWFWGGGGLQILSGQEEGFAQVGGGNKGGRREFSTWFLIFVQTTGIM